jgi:hypothetical protein
MKSIELYIVICRFLILPEQLAIEFPQVVWVAIRRVAREAIEQNRI